MDNFYRKEWDKTLIHHQQLHINHTNGTEFGRTIKKFPLLTPREYILAWKLWQGTNDQTTYYCYSKVSGFSFFIVMHFAVYTIIT